MERNKDYMDVCNTGLKIPVQAFEADVCRQCSRPECLRSSYKQNATDKKLERAKELQKFVDSNHAPVSPLFQVETVVEEAAPSTSPDAQTLPVQRPVDPWEVPKGVRTNIYKEYDDPKKDPWSSEYEGARDLKVKSGATITLTGTKKR